MFVDLRMANVMVEQKREELARSYRSANRRSWQAKSSAPRRRLPTMPVGRRLLPGR